MIQIFGLTLKRFASLVGIITVYSYCIFCYQYSFNYRAEINRQYFFLFLASIAILLILSLKKATYPISIFMLLMQILFLFFFKELLSNEHLTVTLGVLCLSLVIADTDCVQVFKTTLFGLVIVYICQLFLVANQFYSLIEYAADPITIGGSFNNSGIFAIYMVIMMPLVFYCISFFRYGRKIALLTVLSITLFFLLFSSSRTAIASFFAIALIYSFLKYGRYILKPLQTNKALSSIIISILLILVGWLTKYYYELKIVSASARLLRIKVCLPHIFDHPLFGIGFGKFTYSYPLWQIEFFKANPMPSLNYFFSANDSFLAFNEYLQLFIELGLVGFILFSLAIYFIYTTKSTKHCNLLFFVKLSLTAILISSLTSYTLHVIPNLFLIFLFFSLSLSIRASKLGMAQITKKIVPHNFGIAMTVLVVFFIGLEYLKLPAKFDADGRVKFEKNIESFTHNGKLLLTFGETLLNSPTTPENLNRSIFYLESSKGSWISYRTFLSLSKAYELDGNYIKAEENMRLLTFLVPSKFFPRKELVRLYDLNGKKKQARQLAIQTLNMPVKIPSDEVLSIKNYLYNYLETDL